MVKKQALGKGLGALIPERKLEEGRGVVDISVEEIRTSLNQPRKEFSIEKMQELMASISEKGVIQPIIVRRSDQGFDIIAGERRFRAAKKLDHKAVPCVVREATDEEAFEISLIENLQRQDLNPIEEAEGYKRLIEEFGLTQDGVAKKVGKDRASIANSMRLLKLPEKIKRSLANGEISVGHAKALLSCKDSGYQNDLFKDIIKKGLSVREAERRAIRKHSQLKRRGEHALDPHLKAIADDMQRKLATKVIIKMRGKKTGMIEIDFYSHNDLDRLVKHIMQ